MIPKPVVSVIVPAKDAGPMLAEALASVRDQTFDSWEVLVVVDLGHDDDSVEVARPFTEGDPRFRIVSQRGRGVSAARNEGILQAAGEWIAFLDADDLWLADKLSRQLEEARRAPGTDFVFTNYVESRDGVEIGVRYRSARKLPTGSCLPRLVFGDLFGTSTVLVKRELLDRAGLFDTTLAAAEDWDLWLRMAELGWHPAGILEPLVRYRLWSGNASRQVLRTAETDVRVLEERGRLCTLPELAAPYRKSVALARGKLELVRALRGTPHDPGALAPAALRAWRHSPTRLKWLLWYLAAAWPPLLGGRATRERVRRRIEARL